MAVRFRQLSRSLHLWGALIVFTPVIIVLVSGLLLQVKKEFKWIQPATQAGIGSEPAISFESILASASQVPQADIETWRDIDRLDVRPSKGVIKVQSKNSVEIQIDATTGDVIQVATRRSDTIESIHDGSWFFEGAKLWIFLPAGIVLLFIWLSGVVLLYTTLHSRFKRKRARQQNTA
jgi:uncharacterized iron-regulated membrane protein